MLGLPFERSIFFPRCLTRPGGRMLLGIPMGRDEVHFNNAKLYGPLQMSHVLANWEQINSEISLAEDRSRVLWPINLEGSNAPFWKYQPGIVVQKMENKK